MWQFSVLRPKSWLAVISQVKTLHRKRAHVYHWLRFTATVSHSSIHQYKPHQSIIRNYYTHTLTLSVHSWVCRHTNTLAICVLLFLLFSCMPNFNRLGDFNQYVTMCYTPYQYSQSHCNNLVLIYFPKLFPKIISCFCSTSKLFKFSSSNEVNLSQITAWRL